MARIKIKLIIFDAYGVCLTGGYPETCKALAKKFKRNWKELYAVIYTKYFNQAAMKKITQREAWKKAIAKLKLPLSVQGLKKIHYGGMSANKKVLLLAKELKKTYRILLLSKNTRSQFAEIGKRTPEVRKVFGKDIINTWEYDLPKAGKETMDFVFQRFGVRASEVVYIDDQDINLKIPRKLGARTILYENFSQGKKELNRLLSEKD